MTSFDNNRIQLPLIYMLLSCGIMGTNRFCHSLVVSQLSPVFLVLEQTRTPLAIGLPELPQGKHPLLFHQPAFTLNHYTRNILC